MSFCERGVCEEMTRTSVGEERVKSHTASLKQENIGTQQITRVRATSETQATPLELNLKAEWDFSPL